jgi:hypothetical protein
MAEQIKVQSADLPVVDDPSAPTILVDSIAGVIGTNGVFVFGCTQTILEVISGTEMMPKRKIVARLAIPIGALHTIAAFFQDQALQLQVDGNITLHQETSTEDGTGNQ